MMTVSTSTPFEIRNASGDRIRGNVHAPGRPEGAPVIIICHGFKGFKDWGAFPAVAEFLARLGWIAIRFNFSHNGIGDNETEFTELEKFAENTLSKEMEDLQAVIEEVTGGRLFPYAADTSRVALLGHSRGGGIVILKAAEEPRVKAVVSWASVSTFDRWGPETRKRWKAKGIIEVMNTRTNQRMPMKVSLLEDFEANRERFDILKGVKKLEVPLLIVHGEQDVSVPVEEAGKIYEAANKERTDMLIVPNADHVFGARHPFEGMPPALASVLQGTADWLKDHV